MPLHQQVGFSACDWMLRLILHLYLEKEGGLTRLKKYLFCEVIVVCYIYKENCKPDNM